MANRYWVGGTGNWSDDDNHWATTSGGAPANGNIPGTGDSVIFDTVSSTANAAYTITIDATATCLDFTMAGPGLGNNVTWAGSAALSIYGSLNLSGGSTDITRTYTGAITFRATSTGKTITMNGVTLATGIITFNGSGGGWTLQDAFTTTSNFVVTTGAVVTNNQTLTVNRLSCGGAGVRSLTLGTSTVYTTGAILGVDATSVSNLTFSAASSTIIIQGSGGQINIHANGLTFGDVSMTGAAAKNINGANTFNNLTLTGTATKTNTYSLGNDQIVIDTFTVTGNSIANRVLIFSSTIGTPRTVTVGTTATLSNADFTDITAGGTAGTWSGTSLGDALGNSNITFTTPVTRYWVGGTGNWSSTGEWAATSGGASGASIPICHDTVVFDANSFSAGSQTVTNDMARPGAGITFAGDGAGAVTNTPNWTNTANHTIYGALTLVTGMTISGTLTTTFAARSSVNLTTAEKTFTQQLFISAYNGEITLQGNLISTSASGLTLTNGTFTANDYNVTLVNFNSNNSNTRTLNMGAGTWKLSGTGGIWLVSSTLQLNTSTSTIKYEESTGTATAKSFTGAGLTYYCLWFAPALSGTSTGAITIANNNIFTELKDTNNGAGAAHSILFTAASTQTVTTFTVNGTSGNLITINSTTTGIHTLTKAGGGVVSCNYLNIQHSIVGPGKWYAGLNSTDHQGDATAGSGWLFNVPPIPSKIFKKLQAVNRAGTY